MKRLLVETGGKRVGCFATLVAALALLWIGCQAPRYAEKADTVVDLPERYGGTRFEMSADQGSCCGWADPGLTNAIARALRKNFDMQGAWANLRQAEAAARQARASLFPTLNANASASRTRFSTGGGGGFGQFPGGSVGGGGTGPPTGSGNLGSGFDFAENGTAQVSNYELSAAAAYEIDLWGRLRHQAKAARLDAEAARHDAEALAITLTSRVSENWLEVLAQRERQALLKRQMQSSRDFLDLLEVRFAQGGSTGLDLDQQRQQVESVAGSLEIAHASEAVARHQLAVLLGETPDSPIIETNRRALPRLPLVPDPGVPADLLQTRPDLHAAMQRLRAADHRTAAAVADRLPKLELSARLFLQQENVSSLLDELLWSAVGSVSEPILDGGRRAAEVAQTEAAAEAQLYAYAQTLLTAVREVKDALVQSTRQKASIASLRKQRDSAERVLRLAQQRYQQGNVDYLRVLNAQQSLYEVQLNLLDARRQQFSNYIQLCRALGGQLPSSLEQTSHARAG